MSVSPNRYTRIADTNEHLLEAPAILIGIYPENTTAGTVTVRDDTATGGSNVAHTAAIGLTQAGKNFGTNGIRMTHGLTVQLSSASDAVMVVWRPLLG